MKDTSIEKNPTIENQTLKFLTMNFMENSNPLQVEMNQELTEGYNFPTFSKDQNEKMSNLSYEKYKKKYGQDVDMRVPAHDPRKDIVDAEIFRESQEDTLGQTSIQMSQQTDETELEQMASSLYNQVEEFQNSIFQGSSDAKDERMAEAVREQRSRDLAGKLGASQAQIEKISQLSLEISHQMSSRTKNPLVLENDSKNNSSAFQSGSMKRDARSERKIVHIEGDSLGSGKHELSEWRLTGGGGSEEAQLSSYRSSEGVPMEDFSQLARKYPNMQNSAKEKEHNLSRFAGNNSSKLNSQKSLENSIFTKKVGETPKSSYPTKNSSFNSQEVDSIERLVQIPKANASERLSQSETEKTLISIKKKKRTDNEDELRETEEYMVDSGRTSSPSKSRLAEMSRGSHSERNTMPQPKSLKSNLAKEIFLERKISENSFKKNQRQLEKNLVRFEEISKGDAFKQPLFRATFPSIAEPVDRDSEAQMGICSRSVDNTNLKSAIEENVDSSMKVVQNIPSLEELQPREGGKAKMDWTETAKLGTKLMSQQVLETDQSRVSGVIFRSENLETVEENQKNGVPMNNVERGEMVEQARPGDRATHDARGSSKQRKKSVNSGPLERDTVEPEWTDEESRGSVSGNRDKLGLEFESEKIAENEEIGEEEFSDKEANRKTEYWFENIEYSNDQEDSAEEFRMYGESNFGKKHNGKDLKREDSRKSQQSERHDENENTKRRNEGRMEEPPESGSEKVDSGHEERESRRVESDEEDGPRERKNEKTQYTEDPRKEFKSESKSEDSMQVSDHQIYAGPNEQQHHEEADKRRNYQRVEREFESDLESLPREHTEWDQTEDDVPESGREETSERDSSKMFRSSSKYPRENEREVNYPRTKFLNDHFKLSNDAQREQMSPSKLRESDLAEEIESYYREQKEKAELRRQPEPTVVQVNISRSQKSDNDGEPNKMGFGEEYESHESEHEEDAEESEGERTGITENEEEFGQVPARERQDTPMSEKSAFTERITIPNLSEHPLMDNLSSLFPRNHKNSVSRTEFNQSTHSQGEGFDHVMRFDLPSVEKKVKPVMSTNFSFNETVKEDPPAIFKRSKSHTIENLNREMKMESEHRGSPSWDPEKGLQEQEEQPRLEQAREQSPSQAGDITSKNKCLAKNSLFSSLGNSKPIQMEMGDEGVFSFMAQTKPSNLLEVPGANIAHTMNQISENLLQTSNSQSHMEQLSQPRSSQMENQKSLSSELSYGNFSLDAVENKIKDFEHIDLFETKGLPQGKIQIFEKIDEEVIAPSSQREHDKDASEKGESGRERGGLPRQRDSDSMGTEREEPESSQRETQGEFEKNPFEGELDAQTQLEEKGSLKSTKSNPMNTGRAKALYLEMDYDYSNSLGNQKLKKIVQEKTPENSNSAINITYHSILNSRRKTSSCLQDNSSFKESEFEIKFTPNNELEDAALNEPEIPWPKPDAQSAPIRKVPLETHKFRKLEELVPVSLPKEENELSFAKDLRAKETQSKEKQFKKTVEELNMESITMRTQSLDNQSNGVAELMRSKRSSGEDEQLKSGLESLSSRITEFDILKNFEKFDPKGSILRKLIVKYKILTGRLTRAPAARADRPQARNGASKNRQFFGPAQAALAAKTPDPQEPANRVVQPGLPRKPLQKHLFEFALQKIQNHGGLAGVGSEHEE